MSSHWARRSRRGLGTAPGRGFLFDWIERTTTSQLVAEVGAMGAGVREELLALVRAQRLAEEDEWEVFKGQKQGIVTHACIALDGLDGVRPEVEESIGTAMI